MTKPTSATIRPRNAAKTREQILQTARELFGREGYDRIGVRDIAAAAGVNAALVSRYFGSKEQLFITVIGERFAFDGLLEGNRAQFGLRFARYVIDKDEAHRMDSVTALLLSLPGGAASEHVHAQLKALFIEPLAAWLGGRNARLRASLIASELLGFVTLRDIVRVTPLNAPDTLEMTKALARSIQAHVDG